MSKLEFETTDWIDTIEKDKEAIIEDIASHLAKENPLLFNGRMLDGEQLKLTETLIRQAVLTRNDLTEKEAEEAVKTILGQATGYGVLHEFFAPDKNEITEVFINPSQDGPKVFYSMHGRSCPAKKRYFKDNDEALRYCQKICEDVGRPFTEDASIVDAWLPDGSRLAAIGFKTSPLGVAATIRKSPLTRPPMPLRQLVEFSMLPQFAADLITDLLVKGRANIGVFGRTDSGKTTFLRSMAMFIDPIDRTFIGETSLEMHLPHLPNCINLVEVVYGDKTIVDMSQICRTMNRNNPDRAILGEIRGKEIVAASQMASSTSGGFWTTGHAGAIRDLRTRMFGMHLEAGIQLSPDFLDEIIASMFDFIIFLDKETKTEKRKRTLMSIIQVTEDGYQSIIRFDYDEFLSTNGQTRRWIYDNPISFNALSKLAFNGAIIKPEYEKVKEGMKYLC